MVLLGWGPRWYSSFMIAKTLKNPALRDKFKVGDIVRLPRVMWSRITDQQPPSFSISRIVMEVGDAMITHGKNRLCRFAIVLGDGSLITGPVVWEEWMLEKIEVLPKAAIVETCAIEGDETSLPPHQ